MQTFPVPNKVEFTMSGSQSKISRCGKKEKMQLSKRSKIDQSEPEVEEKVILATGYLSAEVNAEGLRID